MAVKHPLKESTPWLLALAAVSILAFAVSLTTGSATIPAADVWQLLWQDDRSLQAQIILDLRLPRSLSAFAVGAILGLAGVLMQVLLRNPLGDPYVLGISGGASAAVLLGMLIGIPIAWHTSVAFVGALSSMLLVFFLAHKGNWNSGRLLLTGIVIAAGWSALISFVLSLSPPIQLPGMLFWLMGDLSDALSPLVPMSIFALGLVVTLWIAPQLNILALGSLKASALGVQTKRLHVVIYLLSSLLTAGAVTIAGAIGFIGLIAPHMVRLLAGSDHRILLPGAAMMGGSLLLLADTAARTVISPMQLPVGVLTAVIGVPVFLLLLNQSYRSKQ